MRTILVCVKTPTAAQAIAAAAARLGVARAVRTAVTTGEALARLVEAPAELVLADPASTGPDTAAFCRRVLETAPDATIIFLGAQEPLAAAAAIGAGARGVIELDADDPVMSLVKGVMLVLSQVGRADDGVPARRVLAPTQVRAVRAAPAGRPDNITVSGTGAMSTAGGAAMQLPRQRGPAAGSDVRDEPALRAFWRLVEASSLGSDGARRLRELADPVRSAVVASRAGLGAGNPAVRYLLGEFVSACYSADGPDQWAGGSAFTQVRTLSRLLLRAGRRGEAAELWRLAAAAGEERAEDEFARVQAPPRQRTEVTERELEVLHGMAAGKSNAELSRELGVSEDTVKAHARRLFRKLGARDRAHAVAAGFRAGLIT